MTDLISQHVGDLVAQIDNTMQVVWNNAEQRGEVCKTKWSRKGKLVTVGIDAFIIDEVNPNEWIKVSQVPPPTFEGEALLPVPFYIHGTKKATNREWTLSSDNLLNKTPIIWLLGTLNYKQFGRESTKDFESSLRIFFLDETDVVNYYTADHETNVVYPMEQLAMEFIETINKDRNYKTIEDWEIIEFTRFGVEQENGMFQNILDANLSGVELRITLTKYKENCKC
tara:strand:- start:3 stop:680 length:678 start_codon:yes stop_codon:yes gene_type:complete